ncbi:MAG: GGDEF domain-containing protein [Lachnospiraceae bacterium]|nr:GGDEF domain-containing protein [Lachnospiraceae bacterium]
MSEYFIYYASSNIVGAIIFGIMLANDRMSIDRQEKQLKYDHALVAFMAYFISDAIWAGVDSGVLAVNTITVLLTNLSNFVIMTGIIYTWLLYVLAVEQIPDRNKPALRLLLSLPFALSTLVLIITYMIDPHILIGEDMKNTRVFDGFLVTVPYIYLIAVIIYAVKAAVKEENKVEKKKHLYIGFFPLIVVMGGLAQMLIMPALPIFCFSATIFMIIFYIQSMDSQISTDPLTKLNNRAQLKRYTSQYSNLRMEGRQDYVVMMDINDFKKINDICGHAEGDKALVLISAALMDAVRIRNYPVFLGRYGGDEFIMITHVSREDELKELIEDIRKKVYGRCEKENKPYLISMGIGYDRFMGDKDSFLKCQQRADDNMYKNKQELKNSGSGTKFR